METEDRISLTAFLVYDGCLTETQADEVQELRRGSRPLLGKLALTMRWMALEAVAAVLREQPGRSMRFGELAVTMGYLQEEEVRELLLVQQQMTMSFSEAIGLLGHMSEEEFAMASRRFRRLCSLNNSVQRRAPPEGSAGGTRALPVSASKS